MVQEELPLSCFLSIDGTTESDQGSKDSSLLDAYKDEKSSKIGTEGAYYSPLIKE